MKKVPSETHKTSLSGALDYLLDEGIVGEVFSGGAVAFRDQKRTIIAFRGTTAWPRLDSAGRAIQPDTLFDLASLTKVVSTLPLAMIALRDRAIRLDEPARTYLPELSRGAGWNEGITVRRLLAHSSGLPAWRPYFAKLKGRDDYLAAIAAERPSYEPGTGFEYSDLGFMLLGWLLERALGGELPMLARELVFEPLGMRSTAYRPADCGLSGSRSFAATEDGNGFERGMALAYAEGRPVIGGNAVPFELTGAEVERFCWRTGIISGQVHDCNCHYGLGGVSGHAGLFSTIDDLSKYPAFWDRGGFLSDELRYEAFARQTPPGSAARGLGWALDDDGTAFHTGFTGTSIRYDPTSGTSTVALTNRVHPAVKDGIADWRNRLAVASREASAAAIVQDLDS